MSESSCCCCFWTSACHRWLNLMNMKQSCCYLIGRGGLWRCCRAAARFCCRETSRRCEDAPAHNRRCPSVSEDTNIRVPTSNIQTSLFMLMMWNVTKFIYSVTLTLTKYFHFMAHYTFPSPIFILQLVSLQITVFHIKHKIT